MRLFVRASAGVLASLVVLVLVVETRTSTLQSIAISRYAAGAYHWLEATPNRRLRYPAPGPFDQRAGYSELPAILPRLEQRGFRITAQARVSTGFERVLDDGLFAVYPEKAQTGLRILDRDGHTMFAYAYPERVLPSFEAIPPLVVRSLLHIENRELLDPDRPYLNPAVEWDRLAMMVLRLGRRSLGEDGAVQGASTLATQIEKFRHSPGGMTQTPSEKFRQMASASVRAYLDGRTTLTAQRRIVLDYLNGLPLAAMANHGEIHGLLDGLKLWYGIDAAALDALREPIAPDRLQQAAELYRASLSLILATRRPAFYLGRVEGHAELDGLSDVHTTLLEREGVIPPALAQAARDVRLVRRAYAPAARRAALFEQKAANSVRADLSSLLGVNSLYRLDRLDLTVSTSVVDELQTNVARELEALAAPERRAEAGLTGPRLLPADGELPITYSILLCEAAEEGNFVRVQTDSVAGPRNANRDTKLELGSTAKLRTLLSYLEAVETVYERLAGASQDTFRSYREQFNDPLTVWVGDLLEREPTLSLEGVLEAALSKRYAASPAERFFTAGGVHTFSNFDDTFDASMPTVREALSQSVNLPFIRIMRDIVRYHEQRIPFARNVTSDARHPLRVTYLSRFAHQEGQQFLRRFYRRHVGKTPGESVDLLIGTRAIAPLRAARLYLSVQPEASVAELAAFARDRLDQHSLREREVAALHHRVLGERWSLSDLAHLTNAHPLELWVAGYLARNPSSSLEETIAAADEALQEAYRWLFRTSRKGLQDTKIRTILEAEAFARIHEGWRRLGYPFQFLVPSYATAIGSSGDSPAALAELMGILVNDGLRRPIVEITGLRFAEQTPFEAHLRRDTQSSERVLSVAVARAVRSALVDVVVNGTGRRVRDAFKAADGAPLTIGGKTGTGDNRHVLMDSRGERMAAYARNRTAVFVFFAGDHFGVVAAHVEGPVAGDFTFTSALPAQLLRHLAPLLEPLLQERADAAPAGGPAVLGYAF
jgi:membrane peptidoglycan carboxypeptidase